MLPRGRDDLGVRSLFAVVYDVRLVYGTLAFVLGNDGNTLHKAKWQMRIYLYHHGF